MDEKDTEAGSAANASSEGIASAPSTAPLSSAVGAGTSAAPATATVASASPASAESARLSALSASSPHASASAAPSIPPPSAHPSASYPYAATGPAHMPYARGDAGTVTITEATEGATSLIASDGTVSRGSPSAGTVPIGSIVNEPEGSPMNRRKTAPETPEVAENAGTAA